MLVLFKRKPALSIICDFSDVTGSCCSTQDTTVSGYHPTLLADFGKDNDDILGLLHCCRIMELYSAILCFNGESGTLLEAPHIWPSEIFTRNDLRADRS